VYGELLRLLEDKVPRCRLDSSENNAEENDASGPTITTSTLAQAISNDINIATGIGQASSNKILSTTGGSNGTRKRKGESSEDEEDVVTAKPRSTKVKFDVQAPGKLTLDSHQARLTQLKDHLLLLTGHNHNLLKKLSNDGLGEFTVPFKNAAEYMRENELDTYVASAFGKEGLRISHILRKHGKLDEKQVQKIALMRQGEVRKTLIKMQMAGFADIQEVPRDTLRTPSRTIFLWWFDTERITNLLLDRIYKSIARCLEVLETERYKERVVLALADRTDVRGNEHEMLPEDHLVKLNAFAEKEDRLTTQINRLDQLVGIFKEF
jgi:DNA-directed RNA polymerase III subunit RPC3